MPTPDQTVTKIINKVRAIERAYRRLGKLIDELHDDLAQAVADHGPAMNVSPLSVAPKDR